MVPTHTLDLAVQIWRFAKEDYLYGIYHITHTGYCSWYEFAKKIIELSGIMANVEPIKSYEFPMKAKRPQWSVLGTKKGLALNEWQDGLKSFLRLIGVP